MATKVSILKTAAEVIPPSGLLLCVKMHDTYTNSLMETALIIQGTFKKPQYFYKNWNI